MPKGLSFENITGQVYTNEGFKAELEKEANEIRHRQEYSKLVLSLRDVLEDDIRRIVTGGEEGNENNNEDKLDVDKYVLMTDLRHYLTSFL